MGLAETALDCIEAERAAAWSMVGIGRWTKATWWPRGRRPCAVSPCPTAARRSPPTAPGRGRGPAWEDDLDHADVAALAEGFRSGSPPGTGPRVRQLHSRGRLANSARRGRRRAAERPGLIAGQAGPPSPLRFRRQRSVRWAARCFETRPAGAPQHEGAFGFWR